MGRRSSLAGEHEGEILHIYHTSLLLQHNKHVPVCR